MNVKHTIMAEGHSTVSTLMDRHNGVMWLDAERCFVEVNWYFAQLAGYEAPELIGKPFAILDAGFHTPEDIEQQWAILDTGETLHGRSKYQKKTVILSGRKPVSRRLLPKMVLWKDILVPAQT